MKSTKIEAGNKFPPLIVNSITGGQSDISKPEGSASWRMVIVYRGRFCPLCTQYLNQLAEHTEALGNMGVDIAVVSADSKAQLEDQLPKLNINFPIYYGLSLEQMKGLGVYISHPRSPEETDHPFSEPGLFVINDSGTVQVVDISNNPFVRPELNSLVSGLDWIRKNDYPIRGSYEY